MQFRFVLKTSKKFNSILVKMKYVQIILIVFTNKCFFNEKYIQISKQIIVQSLPQKYKNTRSVSHSS